MTRLLILIAVLGVFWSQAFASFRIFRLPSNNGDYTQQTVTIDNENQIANIHVYGGSCSSDTIFDYKHGYIATRLFSRRACFVYKMEKGYIPELEEVGRLAYEKQMLKNMLSPKNIWVKYVPSHSFFGSIKEWFVYGSSIEKLCKGVPVYKVERVEKVAGAGGCVKAGLLGILGISICGDIRL
ncbi:gastrokine-2 [Sphaerodactylus townsendi]|uniref:gastrokine-2 n=1 Tax=Sphaerodactylus townsendi TaxID=933632 RepID=UPI00202710D4|nr:gastrokine-2 [Sphaerodactylus townsendi]